ncbi:MAG: NUDIX hydrolase [Burkholderiaceae bacterium]|nr:NUDIX hydrolase [Burkholderiaceae bacterium]
MSSSGKSLSSVPALRQQYGALPYRLDAEQGLQIMLITSRTTRRWIIPKGWPIKGMKPSETAAREAYEEAGLEGEVSRKAVGVYVYNKRLELEDRTVPCEMRVFALQVLRQRKNWPERLQRDCQWLSPAQALALAADEGLRELIARFADRFEAGPG